MIHFDIPNLETNLKTLEKETTKPEFWEDSQNSNKVLSKIKSIKGKCQKYRNSLKGRKSYNPYNLFASILYLNSKRITSVRDMAESIVFDIRLSYIMEQERPSYKTINDFINNVITPNRDAIFSLITKAIIDEFNLDASDQYLDGTKFEANANKYKFVYISEKRMNSLNNKIINLYNDMNITEYNKQNRINSKDFNTNILKYAQRQ